MSGHNHYYQRLFKDGINFLVIGGAGAGLYPPDTENPHTEVKKQARQFHFAIFDVDTSKVSLSVIGYDETQKAFAPIETLDLSCKNGDTRSQNCLIGKIAGIRQDVCMNGAWKLGQCKLYIPIECKTGDDRYVRCMATGGKIGYRHDTCVDNKWAAGICKGGAIP